MPASYDRTGLGHLTKLLAGNESARFRSALILLNYGTVTGSTLTWVNSLLCRCVRRHGRDATMAGRQPEHKPSEDDHAQIDHQAQIAGIAGALTPTPTRASGWPGPAAQPTGRTTRPEALRGIAQFKGGTVDTGQIDESLAALSSLRPGALPQIPGLDLAVRYLPATEGADVGGDWYDAFALAGGRAGLVSGDVAGHNIASASIMGQVRNLLAGYAMHSPDPRRVLRQTNTAVARLLPDVLASVIYAVLDPATGDLTYANAGHPPPLVTTGTGQAEYLDDTAGTMLGACADASFTNGHRQLQPGAGLLCYTDGLIEDRRRDISEGLTALAEIVQRSAPSSAEQTCATVQAALLGTTQREDDVCLLTARLTG